MKSILIQVLPVLFPLFAKGQNIPAQLKNDFKQAKTENSYSHYAKAKEQLIQWFESTEVTAEDIRDAYLIAQEFRDASLLLFIETKDKNHHHSNCTKHNNQ